MSTLYCRCMAAQKNLQPVRIKLGTSRSEVRLINHSASRPGYYIISSAHLSHDVKIGNSLNMAIHNDQSVFFAKASSLKTYHAVKAFWVPELSDSIDKGLVDSLVALRTFWCIFAVVVLRAVHTTFALMEAILDWQYLATMRAEEVLRMECLVGGCHTALQSATKSPIDRIKMQELEGDQGRKSAEMSKVTRLPGSEPLMELGNAKPNLHPSPTSCSRRSWPWCSRAKSYAMSILNTCRKHFAPPLGAPSPSPPKIQNFVGKQTIQNDLLDLVGWLVVLLVHSDSKQSRMTFTDTCNAAWALPCWSAFPPNWCGYGHTRITGFASAMITYHCKLCLSHRTTLCNINTRCKRRQVTEAT